MVIFTLKNISNKINEIDTKNIQPLINPIEEESELREDKAKESIKKEDLLKNSDIISIHLVLGDRYIDLITKNELA